MKRRSRFKRELAINVFMLGQFIDLGTTIYLLKRIGIKHEANPLAQFIMKYTGFEGAGAIKLIAMLALGRHASPWHAGLSAGVAVNNLLAWPSIKL